DFVVVLLCIATEEFRKKTPPRAIPRKMIEAEIGCDRLEPAAGRRAVAQLIEAFEGLEKNLLGNILRLGLIGQQAHGSAEHHVLVVSHECFELLRLCHGQAVTLSSAVYLRNIDRRKTLA